jgi:hypothetical protein
LRILPDETEAEFGIAGFDVFGILADGSGPGDKDRFEALSGAVLVCLVGGQHRIADVGVSQKIGSRWGPGIAYGTIGSPPLCRSVGRYLKKELCSRRHRRHIGPNIPHGALRSERS